MKKTAVLLDLGFVLHKLHPLLGNRQATAIEVRDFALRCIEADEELFRIYCYHCLPYGEQEVHPFTGTLIDFSTTPKFRLMSRFMRDLAELDNVAFRSGQLSFDGWLIKRTAVPTIIRTGRGLTGADFQPDLKQKHVDMKIGLDVAWLSSKGIVERIILVTADSDFVPAMKFARREGVQIVLVTMGHALVKRELRFMRMNCARSYIPNVHFSDSRVYNAANVPRTLTQENIVIASPRTFPCPYCNEIINDSMTQCRYCSTPIDPVAARMIAERQEKANQAYSDASYLRTAMIAMYVFMGISFIPFVPVVGWAFLITFVVVLVLLIRWQARFYRLVTNDADYLKARRSWRLSLILWIVAIPIGFVIRPLVYLAFELATR